MPGAGTDRTREWIEGGPVIVLVEPQLGENIGAAARAMANFGLTRLRLVKPRDGWPSAQARRSASGADRVIDEAMLFDTLEAAIADCTYVLATTARDHHQAKPVIGAGEAAQEMAPRIAAGETVAVVFGRERNGLENEEVALADKIVTLPVNPAFASLNLAQAVLVIAYEWFTLATGGKLPFEMRQRSVSAPREQLFAFFEGLERELERVEFFRPPEKRETMVVNLRNVIHRMQPTQQDVQTLHGVIMALAQGRKGPAKGGILDGAEAELLRELLAGHGDARVVLGARAGARAGAALAAQPDRCGTGAVGSAGQGPPFRRPLQAPGPGRPAHRGFRLVSAAHIDRNRAGARFRKRREKPGDKAELVRRARLSGDRRDGSGDRSRRCRRARSAGGRACTGTSGHQRMNYDGDFAHVSLTP